MFSKTMRASCYRELQVEVVNRHSHLELRNLRYHAASGQCFRPPSAAVLANSTCTATFGTDLAIAACTGCLLYRLTQQTGAPLSSRLFLFIAWKVTKGGRCFCWLEVIEANYDAFPADKNELRRHFRRLVSETAGEEQGMLQRNILLPNKICFSVAATMGNTKKTNMRIELFDGAFDTGTQLVTEPLVLMPFEEDEVLQLDPLSITDQLPSHQEIAAVLEQKLPTVMLYSEHTRIHLIDPLFHLEKGNLHCMPANTALTNGGFCQYLLQPATNGRVRGGMLYSLVVAASTSDAVFLASYTPITMYVLVGWDINTRGGHSRFYMDVLCTDSDIRLEEVMRRRVFSFVLNEFDRLRADPTMVIGRRKFTGELLGVPFAISAYVRSPHVNSVMLEFTEDIGCRSLMKPIWLPSKNDFNHQTLAGAQQVMRERELSDLVHSVRSATSGVIVLLENTHPQVVLEQCDNGAHINSFHQSIIRRQVAPGEILTAVSQVSMENRLFAGHIIYKVHNAYVPESRRSSIAPSLSIRQRDIAQAGHATPLKKKFSVVRALKAAKSVLGPREQAVPDEPASQMFLIVNWAVLSGRQRLLFSAEFLSTNCADFTDASQAQNRYMLLALAALTRNEQGNRAIHWMHDITADEQAAAAAAVEKPLKLASRSQFAGKPPLQLDPSLAVEAHMSLEEAPVLSLSVRQAPNTPNQASIIVYDIVGDNRQPLRDNPCFVIAWRASCSYGRDLQFVANVLQEKDIGYDGRSGLFSLPNLHSLLFKRGGADSEQAEGDDDDRPRYSNEWTGLINADAVYTASLELSLLPCGKLAANAVFSNRIAGTVERAESIPELEINRTRIPTIETPHDSKFDTATMAGTQLMLRSPSSIAFSTSATTATAIPNLFLTIKNAHRDVVLERPLNYSMAGECSSVPETLLAGGYAVEVECMPANEIDTPCAGFLIYSIGGVAPTSASKSTGVYLVIGWRTRFSLQSGGHGEFFSNIIKIRLNEN
ncbi:hypothetical protein SYNPS1DRAFT_23524, partial [Syncephalis pseudoplumigaleata]